MRACLGKASSLMKMQTLGHESISSIPSIRMLLLAANACSVAAPPSLINTARNRSPRAPSTLRRHRSASPRAVVEESQNVTWRAAFSRYVYDTLAPLDRGEFRWSFLVPWTNKTLTSTDKFIICSTFIGSMLTMQSLTNPAASVGVHLSYIAQFFSYTMGDPIGFRSLAVLTAILEIWGNVFEDYDNGALVGGIVSPRSLSDLALQVNGEDIFPIFYDEIFIIINMYYIMRWFLARDDVAHGAQWSENEESLYTQVFAPLGIRRGQFSKLLRSASFNIASESGDTLTLQGTPLTELYVPINGSVEVRVDGKFAANLPPYELIGEASLLENLQSPDGELHPDSRGTVIAPPGTMYAKWPHSAFYQLQQDEDSDFAYAIQLMISRQLSKKLKSARISQSNDMVFQNGSALQAPAEVKALRERGARYERRIESLEKTVQLRDQELSDFKNTVMLGNIILALVLVWRFGGNALVSGQELELGPLLGLRFG